MPRFIKGKSQWHNDLSAEQRLQNNKFKLQLRYYIHFQINILGKDIEHTYPSSYGLNSITAVL